MGAPLNGLVLGADSAVWALEIPMSTFLFTTLPTNDLGLLARALPLAEALAARGHRIVFCSPAKAPSRLIADAGFDNRVPDHPIYALILAQPGLAGLAQLLTSGRWRQYGSIVAYLGALVRALPLKAPPPTPEVWDADHAAAQLGMLNEGFVRANCAALMRLMAESGAEVVVDFWNPFAVIAARALGIPVVTVIQADAHPASRGFIWWKPAPADLPTPVPVLNRVLATYSLPAITTVRELAVGALTLVVGTPETDPLPAGTPVTYVGALLWQRPGELLPDWITRRDRSRPLVWLYVGNPRYGVGGGALDSAIVLRASLAALRELAVQVVLTSGHHALPRALLPLPPNVRHLPYLPGLALAEQSDLLVHHGGYGSCQTGLYTGTPAVIIPTYAERESNARRVAALGAGIVVPITSTGRIRHVDSAMVRNAVRRVLAEPSFAASAGRVREQLCAFGGAAFAAGLIEQVRQVRAVEMDDTR